jgi:mono/diheme cytochrome c family protein
MASKNASPDDKFYKGQTLLKAFGISSVIMLVFTLWMILDDFGREWKKYQLEFFNYRKNKIEKQIEEAKQGLDEGKVKETQARLTELEASSKDKAGQLKTLQKELIKLKTARINKVDKYQAAKGIYDVRKYEYENVYGHKVAHGEKIEEGTRLSKKEQDAREKLNKEWDKVKGLSDSANAAQIAEDAKTAEIAQINSEKDAAEKELKKLQANVDRLVAAKSNSEITISKLLRSAPILDLANPVFKVQQTVIPTIRDDVFFAQVQKVDRCTTCHLAIDTPGFEDAPQPYRTHPNLDLMLGATSPHPTEKVGCTVCHSGRGASVDFVRSAHTPRNEEQKKEWQKKYGWHEMHHVIEKMIPLQYVEGQCRVCHKQTEYVPAAQKLNKSVQLARNAGCYGCHRIEGWDHIRKPAPSLKKVKGKLNHDWIVRWVRNPKSFNDHARMPAQFHQGNTESAEYTGYQEAELFAVADYILSLSEDYKPSYTAPAGGNVERGRNLFYAVGCLGCHGMDEFPEGRRRFGAAPDLSTVGSKVNREWLGQWLKNPRHYWKDTAMPALRLSDTEISDLSAYLLSKKNPQFEKLEVGEPDFEVQKKVLSLYLMRDPKMAPATSEKVHQFVEGLSKKEVIERLGVNAITRYGCYGCHEIKGMETMPGSGVELSEHGSKLVNKFDFGYLDIEKSVASWLHQKFQATRSFDKGVVKEYLDLLRMPNYHFDEGERNKLVTFILGLTAQKIGPPSAKILDAKEAEIEEGSRVIHQYNCQGCHMVEQMYRPLPEGHPDFEKHEKEKWELEGRILTYFSEDESKGPPPLSSEGSRVRSEWVNNFLSNPSWKLRRGIQVRMPSYNMKNDEQNRVVTHWARKGNLEFPNAPLEAPEISGQRLEAAKVLWNKLQCGNCHTVGQYNLTQDDLEGGSKGYAPDITRSYGRLNKDWIVNLLKNPQSMVPGTRMPGFWPEGTSPAPEVLGGDSEKQIDALADYILLLGYQKGGGKPVTMPGDLNRLEPVISPAPKAEVTQEPAKENENAEKDA